jgi:hypothetical protein
MMSINWDEFGNKLEKNNINQISLKGKYGKLGNVNYFFIFFPPLKFQ